MITVTCDYCGGQIDNADSQRVSLEVCGDKGGRKRDRWNDGWVVHYHGVPCFAEVRERIISIHEQRDELEQIPVATPEQVAELRPRDEGESELDFEPLFEATPWVDSRGTPHEGWPEVRKQFAQHGLDFPNEHKVRDADIRTLGDLRRSIENGQLLRVKLIGAKRYAEIKKAVEGIYGCEVSEPASAELAEIPADADLAAFLDTLAPGARARCGRGLRNARIKTLEQFVALSITEVLALPDLGATSWEKARLFLVAREVSCTEQLRGIPHRNNERGGA